MNNTKIDFGKVALKIIEIVFVKIFTLPFIIYKKALLSLSNANKEDSEENNLKGDFPLISWWLSSFDAFIVLIYPLGVFGALFVGIAANKYSPLGGGFGAFLVVLIYTYFSPLIIGFLREAWSITFKAIHYLKIIANK